MTTHTNNKIVNALYLFVSLLAFVFLNVSNAESYDNEAAIIEQYVRKIEDKSKIIVANTSLTSEKKIEKLTAIFLDVVDIDWMAKFAMGKSWNTMSSSKQQQYMSAYKKYLVKSYADKFTKYTGQSVAISAISPTSNQQFIVDTTITVNNQPLAVSYRCKLYSSDNIKIRDITAEGISLLSTQRSEFTSLVSQRGFDGLIEALNNSSAKRS